MYENSLLPTQPGMDIKVTPDNEAPIMPNATIYHGDFLLPRKKDSLLALREVRYAMNNNRNKYPTTISNMRNGFKLNEFAFCKGYKPNAFYINCRVVFSRKGE